MIDQRHALQQLAQSLFNRMREEKRRGVRLTSRANVGQYSALFYRHWVGCLMGLEPTTS